MPRLPIHKHYRAFPELDAFADSECERFVRAARSQRGWGRGLLPVLGCIGAGVAGYFALYAVIICLEALKILVHDRSFVVFAVFLFLVIFIPLLVGFCIRDAVLIRGIRSRIRNASCTNCSFSLLGLPVNDGAVRCPECGAEIVLSEIGLLPGDLLTPTDPLKAMRGFVDRAKCESCGFPLTGLPIDHETVRCPECGTKKVLSVRTPLANSPLTR